MMLMMILGKWLSRALKYLPVSYWEIGIYIVCSPTGVVGRSSGVETEKGVCEALGPNEQ